MSSGASKPGLHSSFHQKLCLLSGCPVFFFSPPILYSSSYYLMTPHHQFTKNSGCPQVVQRLPCIHPFIKGSDLSSGCSVFSLQCFIILSTIWMTQLLHFSLYILTSRHTHLWYSFGLQHLSSFTRLYVVDFFFSFFLSLITPLDLDFCVDLLRVQNFCFSCSFNQPAEHTWLLPIEFCHSPSAAEDTLCRKMLASQKHLVSVLHYIIFSNAKEKLCLSKTVE